MSKIKLGFFAFCITFLVFAIGHLHLIGSVEAGAAETAATTAISPPTLSSWKLNRVGLTGYNGITANVQQVRYSNDYVYVNSTSIPTYSIGPWTANPNIPTNQNFLFKIPRNPVTQTGTHTPTPLGAIAFWTDGVAIFNALDGFSYNNQNIWHQDAVVNEGISFDTCKGHPAPMGSYHHHQNPKCLYNITPTQHSPIVGYAYDGYPIYGAYAYANTDGTGGIKRMTSSYRLRNITDRTVLPNGTVLQPSQYGPSLATKALGTYVEDYEYVAGLGDLDQYNGRFAVTPEYPGGIYAYYVTIYPDGSSAYPYYIGPSYYGIVAMENITGRGHVTISEPVTNYLPSPVFCDFDGDNKTDISIFRPSLGQWWINRSSSAQTVAAQFGNSSDKLVPGDFTGDGKADIAVFRPATGEWFVLRSDDGSFFSFPFGTTGDVPVAADFDGDGRLDPGVFRPSNSTWFISKSSGGTLITTFGTVGDVPVTADYDGDGKSDIAIYRPSAGQWWYSRSSDSQTRAVTFGVSSDKPVPSDYTGDGKADIAFFRPNTGEWFILRSEDSSFFSFPFGMSGDVPAPGDYDGDGRVDPAVFRPSSSTWFVNRTTSGILITTFGTTGVQPVPNVFVP